MHPHLQIPQSALQKKQEMERRLKEQEQQAMQQVQEVDQHQYEYHEGITQYAENGQQKIGDKNERVKHFDHFQNYEYEQDQNSLYGQSSSRPHSRASQHTSSENSESQFARRANGYFQHVDVQSDQDENEMW